MCSKPMVPMCILLTFPYNTRLETRYEPTHKAQVFFFSMKFSTERKGVKSKVQENRGDVGAAKGVLLFRVTHLVLGRT